MHYAVGVVVNAEERMNWNRPRDLERTIDRMLDPFDEEKVTERHIEKTRQEMIDQQRAEYKRFEKGLYAEYLEDPEEYLASCSHNPEHQKYISTFGERLNWTDEQLYAEAREWYEEENFDEEGNLWSTYNPNSQWDWYEIGGRFIERLTTKEGKQVTLAKLEDLDFGPQQERMDEARRHWEQIVEEDRFGKKQKSYMEVKFGTKENYARDYAVWRPYALLMDGGWIELDEEPHEVFTDRMKERNQEDMIVIVDCHI